jgi:hypothetical protein
MLTQSRKVAKNNNQNNKKTLGVLASLREAKVFKSL